MWDGWSLMFDSVAMHLKNASRQTSVAVVLSQNLQVFGKGSQCHDVCCKGFPNSCNEAQKEWTVPITQLSACLVFAYETNNGTGKGVFIADPVGNIFPVFQIVGPC